MRAAANLAYLPAAILETAAPSNFNSTFRSQFLPRGQVGYEMRGFFTPNNSDKAAA